MAPRPTDARLREVFAVAERAIEDRWGIPVRISDVPNPFTGDLDGAEISIDYDLDIGDAVFILVHLFGHTVQWNVSAQARALARRPPGPWTEPELEAVAAYEREACAYSLQLLHDCGVHDLDQWISDFAACDASFLMHLYRTGEKPPLRSHWVDDTPPLAPRPIPAFQPTRWHGRWDGTVV